MATSFKNTESNTLRKSLMRDKSLTEKLVSPDVLAPFAVGVLFVLGWDLLVRFTGLPPYLLPGPLLQIQTLIDKWSDHFASLTVT
ncbi:MAG: ABC transporter permease, partial [Cyanobacteria bacterium P01_F01_bin.153]